MTVDSVSMDQKECVACGGDIELSPIVVQTTDGERYSGLLCKECWDGTDDDEDDDYIPAS